MIGNPRHLGATYVGNFDWGTVYQAGDVVRDGEGLFIALDRIQGVDPSDNSGVSWEPYAPPVSENLVPTVLDELGDTVLTKPEAVLTYATIVQLQEVLENAGLSEAEVEQLLLQFTTENTVVRDAAVQAIQAAAIEEGILTADVIEEDEIRISFSDGDVFLRFDLATGRLLSPVALENVKTKGGDPVFTELTADQGWDFTITYADGGVAFGIRADGTIYPDIKAITPTIARVCAFGDSITAGWASSIGAMGTVIGRSAEARGNGGTSSPWIAARQGGQPLRVTAANNSIPASGAVNVTVAHTPGVGATAPVPATGSYPGVLGGIAGLLTVTSGTDGTFTRTAAGRVTPLPASSPFVTGLDARDAFPIFWAGRNNYRGARDGEQIIADTARMMSWSRRAEHALVLSILPWAGEELGTSIRATLDGVNAAIRDAFPTAFLDVAAMLRSEAILNAVGVTPTATDIQDIANGLTPTSFRYDAGHPNAKGYEALNLIVGDWYKARGLTAAQLELATA